MRRNGKWGLIDLNSSLIVDYQFDDLGQLHGGLAAAKVDNKAGFISLGGSWTIQPRFDNCYRFFGLLAVATKGNTYSYVRRSGTVVWESERGARVLRPPVIA